MSEHEKNTGGNVSDGSSVVMIESAARHKEPYRPTGMHESSPEFHHKHSKAPAVPSVAEELKEAIESTEAKERKEFERVSSEKHKQTVAKKLSSSTKRRGSSPEAITLAPLEVETKKGSITPSPQPIPAEVSAVVSEESGLAMDKPAASEMEKKYDDDSITEEIESRTPEVVKRSSEWSDDEEASGLPRSDSRASRVSRVVRQLFCCGASYDAASEHQISPRGYTNGI